MKTKTRALGVIGSPRRDGNTHILVSRFLEGALSEGAEVDTVFLGDLRIEECDGCQACWRGKQCSKNDDMLGLYPRLIDSDIVVFGTPVYWYGPTALMKGFVDRLVYFNCPENRPKIRGKSAVIIIPFEEENPETARLVVEFFEKSLVYLEMKLIGRLIVPGVGEKGAVSKQPQRLMESYKLGQRLVRGDF
jgi:multimeric flavodoxin WrbA